MSSMTNNTPESTNLIDDSQALLEAAAEFTASDPLHQATMRAFRQHIHRLLQRADLPLKELSQLAGIYAKLLRAEMAFRKQTTPAPTQTQPAKGTERSATTQTSPPPVTPKTPTLSIPSTTAQRPGCPEENHDGDRPDIAA